MRSRTVPFAVARMPGRIFEPPCREAGWWTIGPCPHVARDAARILPAGPAAAAARKAPRFTARLVGMSPFLLATGHVVSCTQMGRRHLYEHSATCACPCPPCIDMHRKVLERFGLLEQGVLPSRLFVFAMGELRVSDSPPGEPDRSWFPNAYWELEQTLGRRDRIPQASFGWLVPSERPGTLVVVRAPSDPSEGRAGEALATWAREHGVELEDLADRWL